MERVINLSKIYFLKFYWGFQKIKGNTQIVVFLPSVSDKTIMVNLETRPLNEVLPLNSLLVKYYKKYQFWATILLNRNKDLIEMKKGKVSSKNKIFTLECLFASTVWILTLLTLILICAGAPIFVVFSSCTILLILLYIFCYIFW